MMAPMAQTIKATGLVFLFALNAAAQEEPSGFRSNRCGESVLRRLSKCWIMTESRDESDSEEEYYINSSPPQSSINQSCGTDSHRNYAEPDGN